MKKGTSPGINSAVPVLNLAAFSFFFLFFFLYTGVLFLFCFLLLLLLVCCCFFFFFLGFVFNDLRVCDNRLSAT